MRGPRFAAVDDETADLLDLIGEDRITQAAVLVDDETPDPEWETFVQALHQVAREHNGKISPNRLRPLVRGKVSPNRIGAFVHRALAQNVIVWRGDWETSDDREGRNSGKPARCYWLAGGAA